MSSCEVTTRLLQASLSIQQFVQRCFLSLESPQSSSSTSADPSNGGTNGPG